MIEFNQQTRRDPIGVPPLLCDGSRIEPATACVYLQFHSIGDGVQDAGCCIVVLDGHRLACSTSADDERCTIIL